MKKIRLLILLLVAVFSCSKEDPLPTTGNIRGKITDAQNSSPLRDVNVEIGGNSYTTGSDGSYFFNDLPERSYTVSVSKSGYIADSKSVMVRADQTALADFVLSKNLPTVEPASVTISTEEGSKSVTLRNTQAEPIGFSTQSSKPWITVSPGSGTIAGNSQTIISVAIDFNEIGFGTFSENVIINVSGSSITLPISVVKGEPSFINILEPIEGGIYSPEELMSILWESNLSGSVDISLLRSGSSSIFKVVEENYQNANGGSLNWSIPEIDPGEYRLKIVSKQEVSISDITGNFFIGNDPSIPFIERDQEFSYVEDQEAGFVIGTLVASDDLGIESFEFMSGNTAGYFAISNAGKLTLTSQGVESPANDYEQTPNEFTLSVKAIDADGNESVSTPIDIKVVDFDDEPPVVEANQSFTYSEGRPANFILGKVEASDDVGVAAFNIVSGNDQGYFTINGLGEFRLTTAGLTSPANDYEQAPNAFTIAVTAADQSGNVSEAVSMNIIVTDSDDIAPVVQTNQEFSFAEGQQSGYTIGTISASDNVQITQFRIVSGNTSNYFSIDNSGFLRLTSLGASENAASNDFEIQPNVFSLQITALDQVGNESEPVAIQINVLDVQEVAQGLIIYVDAQNNQSYNGSGTTWSDLSGNSYNGQLRNGVSFVEGGIKYFKFDGVDDYVDFGNKSDYNFVNQFTALIPVFVESLGDHDNVIFSNEGLYVLGIDKNSGHLKYALANTSPGWGWIDTGYEIPQNKWNLIAFRYDSGKIELFVNGDSVYSFNGSGPLVDELPDLNGIWLGSRIENGSVLNGRLARFQLYGDALTNSDIESWSQSISQVYSNTSIFFRDPNGVTVKCEDCQPGDTGVVDGITYTAVNRQQLESLIDANADVTRVCTSLVTDMSFLFAEKNSFDQDISTWDLSNVTSTKQMFRLARAFNQDISKWNVSSVTNMEGMFYAASRFNKPLNNWDVSMVTNFIGMFNGASSFNQPLNQWNTSSATNISDMFWSATSFNQNINDWNVSNVEYMHGVFWGAHAFNQPLNKWNTSKVKTTTYMFAGAYGLYATFNQDISSWDVSNVTEMQYMFEHNKDFNKPLNDWDVSKVENMEAMFMFAPSFNQDLDQWNTASLKNITKMFRSAEKFNGKINTWDVSGVQDLTQTFNFAREFNQPLNSWDVSSVINMTYMFSNSKFNKPIDSWDTSSVVAFTAMFQNNRTFNQPLNSLSTATLGNIHAMFEGASAFNQDLSNWDVSRCTDFSRVFNGASSFNKDLSNWNVANGDRFYQMFAGAVSFNQPLENWDTSKANRMDNMFNQATTFNQNLSKWCVPNFNSEPEGFATGSGLQESYFPAWGTCPE